MCTVPKYHYVSVATWKYLKQVGESLSNWFVFTYNPSRNGPLKLSICLLFEVNVVAFLKTFKKITRTIWLWLWIHKNNFKRFALFNVFVLHICFNSLENMICISTYYTVLYTRAAVVSKTNTIYGFLENSAQCEERGKRSKIKLWFLAEYTVEDIQR